MKKIYHRSSRFAYCALLVVFCLLFFDFCLNAQQLINNKGNRNQSYPVITETKQEIVELINQVSQDSIENYIRFMQQFYRIATSQEALTVQNWLVNKLESFGYEDISIHYFSLDAQQLDAGNVVAVKKGIEFPDEYILITSHYDSPSYNNPVSPGANDNASGTSGVLECARLLKNVDTKRSIIFLHFNGEEFGLVGSMAYANKCAFENMNIIAVINMDMIGWFPVNNPDNIMASGYSYISKAIFEYYQHTANMYIPKIPTIRLTIGDLWGADHMPFNIHEYPSLTICDAEYIDNNYCYHKQCDTIGIGIDTAGVNNLVLARAFVQAVLSATAELSNAWLPPQNLSACQGLDKITVSWDNDNESSSYSLFKNNVLMDEITVNFYEDYDVTMGNKYEYYVIAVNNETGEKTAPSNKDEVTFIEPLHLPYFNDFSSGKYGFEHNDWVLKQVNNKSTLCNTKSSGSLFSDNYLSIAELDWFSIPNTVENVSIRFKWRGNILGMGQYWNINNAGMWFEVTNDRKTWNKLAYISGKNFEWGDYEFSLNNFIGSIFFQARFRLESSGSEKYSYTKIGYITDIEINFEIVNSIKKNEISYIKDLHISPNPATENIIITTFQNDSYQISIYDLMGKRLFQQNGFTDGSLDVSFLTKGAYLIAASISNHRIVKKLIIL